MKKAGSRSFDLVRTKANDGKDSLLKSPSGVCCIINERMNECKKMND
jgi:hypothetical protein